VDAAIIWE
jgi:hypothetical protein